MSRVWRVYTAHVPDLNFTMKLMSGIRKVMSGTRRVMSGIQTAVSETGTVMSGIGIKYLSIFRTSKVDVQNMDSENWP